MNDIEFALRLKQALEKSDLSQLDASKILSINKDSMSNYAKGRLPKAEILRELAKLCNVSCDWLLTGKGLGPGEYRQSEYNQSFALRLKDSLSSSGFSKKELIEKLDISDKILQNYMEGEIPTARVLLALSKTLGVSMEWLLSGETYVAVNNLMANDSEYKRGVIDTLDIISKTVTLSMREAIKELKSTMP